MAHFVQVGEGAAPSPAPLDARGGAIAVYTSAEVDALIAAAIATFKATLANRLGGPSPSGSSFLVATAGTVTRFLGNLTLYNSYPISGAQRLLGLKATLIVPNGVSTATTIKLFKNGVAVPAGSISVPATAQPAGTTFDVLSGGPLAFADGDTYDVQMESVAGVAGSFAINVTFVWSPTTS